MNVAFVVPDHRERLAPIPLTREQPITQPVGDGAMPRALGFQPCGHGRLGFLLGQTIEAQFVVCRIYGDSVARVSAFVQVRTVGIVGGPDGTDDV